MKIVHTCKYKNLVTRIKPTDLVNLKVSDMPPIPANSNPFHHDSFSMGTELVRGWMAMHAGFSSNDGLEDMYLVNTTTGQRLFLELTSKTPEYETSVYINEAPDLDPRTIFTWVRRYEEVDWLSIDDHIKHTAGDTRLQGAPLYVVVDKWFVLLSTVVNAEKRAEFIESHEPSEEAVRNLNDNVPLYEQAWLYLVKPYGQVDKEKVDD